MGHQFASEMLNNAVTFRERTEAVRKAIELGMPLAEIEQHLDWLDSRRPCPTREPGRSRVTSLITATAGARLSM
jgi:hypothetical protein